MATFIEFSISTGSESEYTGGELDGITGTAGAVALAGATLLLGGLSSTLEGGSHGCLFESAPDNAVYSGTFSFETTDLDITPFVPGTSGTAGAVSLYAATIITGAYSPAFSIGSCNSCLFSVLPVTTTNLDGGRGTGGRVIWKCPNFWDTCLHDELRFRNGFDWSAVRRYSPGSRCTAPCEPWIRPPGNASVFRPLGVIALPAVEGTDQTVFDVTVPAGMTGIVTGVMFQFTGSGFEYGSGDLLWTIRIGLWYVKGLQSVTIPLGGPRSGYFPLDGGHHRIQSLQRIRGLVRLGTGALARLDPAGKIIVSLDGYLYPEASWRIDQ